MKTMKTIQCPYCGRKVVEAEVVNKFKKEIIISPASDFSFEWKCNECNNRFHIDFSVKWNYETLTLKIENFRTNERVELIRVVGEIWNGEKYYDEAYVFEKDVIVAWDATGISKRPQNGDKNWSSLANTSNDIVFDDGDNIIYEFSEKYDPQTDEHKIAFVGTIAEYLQDFPDECAGVYSNANGYCNTNPVFLGMFGGEYDAEILDQTDEVFDCGVAVGGNATLLIDGEKIECEWQNGNTQKDIAIFYVKK